MTDILCLIDQEIECLKQEDPLRIWNRFFAGFNSKVLSKYRKKGKYRFMLLIQHSDKNLHQILRKLRDEYSFINSDFNDLTGELIVKNIKSGEFESIYIGDNVAEMVLEVCESYENKELKIIRIEQEKQLARDIREEKRNNKLLYAEAIA